MTARWIIGEQSPRRAVARGAGRDGRGVVDLLLALAVLTLMGLSDYALEFFGIPYISLGGSIVAKIHPSTYLVAAALALAVLANRSPVVYVFDLLARWLGATCLLVACLVAWVLISRYKPDYPASFLIDTLMAAALIVLLFADAGERSRLAVARVVHVVMVFNCLLAITEAVSGWRLFPFVMAGREQSWEYRATALFGHPLIGALITGVYAVILMTVRDVRGLSERWRTPVLLLCMATMPFIGSRLSFTIVYSTAATVALLGVLKFLYGNPVSIRRLLAVMILAPLGILALAVLFQMGLFDNFIDRFMNDKGSAESRLRLFDLFNEFGLQDLLVGQTLAALDTNVRLNGLTEGIENSWAGHLVRYGIAISAVLWFGVAAWFADMLRAAGRGAVLPLVFVFLVVSTTTGISAKVTMLTIPAVLILALVARVPDDEAAAVRSDLLPPPGARSGA